MLIQTKKNMCLHFTVPGCQVVLFFQIDLYILDHFYTLMLKVCCRNLFFFFLLFCDAQGSLILESETLSNVLLNKFCYSYYIQTSFTSDGYLIPSLLVYYKFVQVLP